MATDPSNPERAFLRLLAWVLAIVLAGILLGWATDTYAQPIPLEAQKHQRELTRVIQQEWGLGGSAARAAALIHQESAWRPEVGDGTVTSWAGAQGYAQFMPSTAGWISELYPDLGPPAPFTANWSMRAMARYTGWLFARTEGHTHCDHWHFVLRAYNGGLGHLRAESRNATDPLDRVSVDATCGTARRAEVHCAENLGYPRRILIDLEPRYLKAGWSGRPTCSQP